MKTGYSQEATLPVTANIRQLCRGGGSVWELDSGSLVTLFFQTLGGFAVEILRGLR